MTRLAGRLLSWCAAAILAGAGAPRADTVLLGGKILGQHQKISRLEALRAMTSTAVYMSFSEQSTGSLEPGKLADLTVLDRDYLTCPEEEIRKLGVLLTMVGGQVVFERKGLAR